MVASELHISGIRMDFALREFQQPFRTFIKTFLPSPNKQEEPPQRMSYFNETDIEKFNKSICIVFNLEKA